MPTFLRKEKRTEQELILETDCDKTISLENDSGHYEHCATASCDNTAHRSQVHIWSRPLTYMELQLFTGGPSGLRIQEVDHANKDSTLITIYLHGSDPDVGGRDQQILQSIYQHI